MIAEIICVGTELLLGDILNTNAQFIAKKLAHLGFVVHYQTVVGDNPDRIRKALDIAFDRADFVVMTGGLGPTKDDLTKEMLAKYFNRKLILDEKALANIEKRARKYGNQPLSESNKKQAYVPENAIILYNEHGSAPGYIIEQDFIKNEEPHKKIAVLLPGPPKEMEPMFSQCCEEHLRQYSTETFVSVNVYLQGIGESKAADIAGEMLDAANPTVAPYAKDMGMHFRVTAAAKDQAAAAAMIKPVVTELQNRLGQYIVKISDPE